DRPEAGAHGEDLERDLGVVAGRAMIAAGRRGGKEKRGLRNPASSREMRVPPPIQCFRDWGWQTRAGSYVPGGAHMSASPGAAASSRVVGPVVPVLAVLLAASASAAAPGQAKCTAWIGGKCALRVCQRSP